MCTILRRNLQFWIRSSRFPLASGVPLTRKARALNRSDLSAPGAFLATIASCRDCDAKKSLIGEQISRRRGCQEKKQSGAHKETADRKTAPKRPLTLLRGGKERHHLVDNHVVGIFAKSTARLRKAGDPDRVCCGQPCRWRSISPRLVVSDMA